MRTGKEWSPAHTILSENVNICHEVGGAAAAGVRVGGLVYTRHGLKQSPLPVASLRPPLFARGSSPQPSPTIRGGPAGKTPSVPRLLCSSASASSSVGYRHYVLTTLEGCEDIVPHSASCILSQHPLWA